MSETVHASAVVANGEALLIRGDSGAGKSALALDLIALGAGLIADDLVALSRVDGVLVAAHPTPGATEALIEARGIGLLRLPAAAAAPVGLVIDLARVETERLPPIRHWRGLPLLHRPSPLHPAALLVTLRAGGPEDPEAAVPSHLRPAPPRPKLLTNVGESAENG
ncbi:serine kinase [Pikeienuella piscinae]|uniref:Serine kinase n=1 Tax=Pikeienuella piscinae TaxID=2748098 RepID=A0A7L5BUG8_9RHOB|nr:serine kinase [Pikeienuella piscinae]QIE54338.1 serine kinase [Pikeienuella piscinae]